MRRLWPVRRRLPVVPAALITLAAMIAFAALQRPEGSGDPRRVSARSRIA